MGGNHFVQNRQKRSNRCEGVVVVVPSAMMFQSKPISFLQPQCFCKMHQEAFENGMDNLMTLDTIGESLSLQIKLSSHPDGVLYKDGWSNRDEPWFGCLGHRRVRSRNRWPTQLFLSLPLSGAVSNLTISCPLLQVTPSWACAS